MKPVTWDMPGLTWDNPNLRWGDPSVLLEEGDEGYVPYPPVNPTPPPPRRHMSNNPIPKSEKSLLALAEDCADGCADLENIIGLKQTKEEDLRPLIIALKGDPLAEPVVPGLLYEFKQVDGALTAAETARRNANDAARLYLTQARAALVPILGAAASPEWALAGFSVPGGNSNAVPGTQEGRLATLALLAIYLTQHPTYQVAAGGPRPEVTAARTSAVHTALSNARDAANVASTAQGLKKGAKDEAVRVLRRRLIALVDELDLKLGADDPRWETFGLNIPSNPRAPDPATELVLTAIGAGKILAEWERGRRSNNDRVLIQIVGVDPEYREYGKSGGDSEEVIKDLPAGATVRVKIIALNGSLEAASGPEAEVVLGS